MFEFFAYVFVILFMIAFIKIENKRRVKKAEKTIREREGKKIRAEYEKLKKDVQMLRELLDEGNLTEVEKEQTKNVLRKGENALEKCRQVYKFR